MVAGERVIKIGHRFSDEPAPRQASPLRAAINALKCTVIIVVTLSLGFVVAVLCTVAITSHLKGLSAAVECYRMDGISSPVIDSSDGAQQGKP